MKILPTVPTGARGASARTLATATIDHIDDGGVVHVAMDGDVIEAQIAVPLGTAAPVLGAGTKVVVLVEPDGHDAPVIVSTVLTRLPDPDVPPPVIEIAGQSSVILRCGEASISLHADGTIEIHGERIDSHAEGIQRIKGAQVRIN
jgi:hypothetical protein